MTAAAAGSSRHRSYFAGRRLCIIIITLSTMVGLSCLARAIM